MKDYPNTEKNIVLSIFKDKDHARIEQISYALSSMDRIKILQTLLSNPKNISEISKELDIPIASVSRHIDILENAGLIFIYYQPNFKGRKKYSSQTILSFTFSLEQPSMITNAEKEYSVEMPIGLFSRCHIKAPCGLAGSTSKIGEFDSPEFFFSPQRINADLIWFDKGFIGYDFPIEPLTHHKCTSLNFSFEICSETSYYNNVWPSDITIIINGIEVTTFTSPGDFGGRRGKYTPKYWPIKSTQFGLLKNILVNNQGVFVDNLFVHSNVKFDDLKLYDNESIKLDIGIKDDAVHAGGVNLFGKKFGDHPQSIVMSVK